MGTNRQHRGRGNDPAFPRLLGGRLCLDYVNTIESPRDRPQDFLRGYPDVVRWGRHAGVLADAETAALMQAGERRPQDATAVFARAIVLRGALTRIFRSVAGGGAPDPGDLDAARAEYLIALDRARLAPGGDGFAWTWDAPSARPALDLGLDLDLPLWPVARSAVDVLTGDDLSRVKECPGADDCGWLFYDTSKNASRRWCSMEGCGSRVKMRHHYARTRAGAT